MNPMGMPHPMMQAQMAQAAQPPKPLFPSAIAVSSYSMNHSIMF